MHLLPYILDWCNPFRYRLFPFRSEILEINRDAFLLNIVDLYSLFQVLMKKETINQTEIVFYNSIREVPEWKWQLLQSILLQKEYIGSTLADVAKHHGKFDLFIKAKQYDELLEERINLTICFNTMLKNISIKSKALVCLIHTINGEPVDIISEDKQDEVYKQLLATNISTEKVDLLLEELKKNY